MAEEPEAWVSAGERFDTARMELADLCARVLEEVERGIAAWNEGDATLAERVIEGDAEIDRRSRALEEEIMSIHLRWSAFGEDLRLLHVGLIQAVALERVGNLAVEIARLTTQTPPPLADVEAVNERMRRLGERAVDAMAAATEGMARNDVEAADRARRIWDEVEPMLDAIITEVSRTFEEETSRRWSASAVLVARHMERIANNAAELGGRVRFLVTGQPGPGETDAESAVAD
jgi:phosphate transport system protein